MPDWSIKIIASGYGAASFVPDLHGANPGDPLRVQQDDLVTWNNTTGDSHQPWPADSSFKPLSDSEVTRGSAKYLSDVIAPGASSRPSYDVASPATPAPQSWTVYYVCKLHPEEHGTIEAFAVPAFTVNYIEGDAGTSLDPAQIAASPGQLVSWFNDTGEPHQPWPADANQLPLPESQVPKGGANYLSDVIPSGTYSLTFAYSAPVDYVCRIHPDASSEHGMLVTKS